MFSIHHLVHKKWTSRSFLQTGRYYELPHMYERNIWNEEPFKNRIKVIQLLWHCAFRLTWPIFFLRLYIANKNGWSLSSFVPFLWFFEHHCHSSSHCFAIYYMTINNCLLVCSVIAEQRYFWRNAIMDKEEAQTLLDRVRPIIAPCRMCVCDPFSGLISGHWSLKYTTVTTNLGLYQQIFLKTQSTSSFCMTFKEGFRICRYVQKQAFLFMASLRLQIGNVWPWELGAKWVP